MEKTELIKRITEILKDFGCFSIGELDAEKFFSKGNGTAGTRVRQAMQELKKLAQDLRIEVQEAKNNKA